ncbi:type IV pilus twitching motility protein PilT [bacterium]|nr:type IV pilus twitching motility protein PilT [bacterium]
MISSKASDLHIVAGVPPMLRLDGELVPTTNHPVLTPEETRRIVYSAMTDNQKARFEEKYDVDFSLSVQGLARFRVNVHRQRGSVAASLRAIPHEILSIEDLRLPQAVYELARRPRGLVLVTGPTGSGKSTTLAAMIDLINAERTCHIITIEDPIEYLHRHKRSVIEQREIEADTHTFSDSLKYALRQDPDVILIGEMRDLETISAAITAAETGHLVLATLHTTDAPQTVDRIIDVFPPHQQQQIRIQLSVTLEGVLSQQLLPRAHGKGRVCGVEVLIGTPAVQALIREGKTHQLYSVMETSAKYGMQSLDRALLALFKKGLITHEEALRKARKKEDLARVMAM